MKYIIALSLLFASPQSTSELPKNWFSGILAGGLYTFSTEQTSSHGAAVAIRSAKDWKEGEANVGTGFRAESYRTKRVRFTAWVKTEAVTGSAGLWFQVLASQDKGAKPKIVRFDNMPDTRLVGSNDWKKLTIVQDVPAEGTNISIGSFLVGQGQVWLAEPKFDEVGKDVPLTSSGASPQERLPERPQLNLGLKS